MADKGDGSIKEMILAAACTLFADLGFEKVSTRDIAAAVDIRQASLYHHFQTKQHLYDAVTAMAVGSVVSTIRDAITGRSEPRDRILAFFHTLIVVLHSDTPAARLLDREFLQRDGTTNVQAREILSHIPAILSDIVRTISPDCDAERMAFYFCSLAYGARRPLVQIQFEELVSDVGLEELSRSLATWAIGAIAPTAEPAVDDNRTAALEAENQRLRDLVIHLSLHRFEEQRGT